VIISPRFADIFRGNSHKGGLLTLTLDEAHVEHLWELIEADPDLEITVDLEAQEVTFLEHTRTFELDEYVRWRLLEGLDDVGLTHRHTDLIGEFEELRPSWLPQTTPG
jgi:3-isopropylmalate/(R)-2-methylmalate dehydratase small subunit